MKMEKYYTSTWAPNRKKGKLDLGKGRIKKGWRQELMAYKGAKAKAMKKAR